MNMHMHRPELIERLLAGPYDELYAARPDNILWGDQPSRLVQQFLSTQSNGGRALDVGCGDGANALSLETSGFDVVGVDISSLALRGLRNRFALRGRQTRGKYLNEDVIEFPSHGIHNSFDCIVSCGLFHCLPSDIRVEAHRALFELSLNPKGMILFSCLTNAIPLPRVHGTDTIQLATRDELEALFHEWDLVQSEYGIIDDSHHPVIGNHRHSIFWAIAKRKESP